MFLAIPSEISIRTKSRLGSPALLASAILVHQLPIVESITPNKTTDAAIHRLLTYAHIPNTIIESEQTGVVFNDLQLILNSGRNLPKCSSRDVWSPAIEEDIVKIRNLMNLTRGLSFEKESRGT
jgi:hypothetical protein